MYTHAHVYSIDWPPCARKFHSRIVHLMHACTAAFNETNMTKVFLSYINIYILHACMQAYIQHCSALQACVLLIHTYIYSFIQTYIHTAVLNATNMTNTSDTNTMTTDRQTHIHTPIHTYIHTYSCAECYKHD
jgi:hypothetical protein